MGKAEILRGPRVINSNHLSGISKHDLDGFLLEFTIGETTYFYRSIENFKLADTKNPTNMISVGYYKKDIFLNYYSGRGTLDSVKNSLLEKDKRIKDAEKNDQLKIRRLLIVSPYSIFYRLNTWTFPYNGILSQIIDRFGNINIPSGIDPEDEDSQDANIQAKLFYNKRKIIVNSFRPEQKDQAALLITKIGLLVNMINEEIFPLFETAGSQDFSTYINDQNIEWQTGNVLDDHSFLGLNTFMNGLNEYYRKAFVNQVTISNAVGLEKLYWFASLLSPNGLASFPVNTKLELLDYITKNKLSENFEKKIQEDFVIKILQSFNENNLSQIDVILSGLVDPNYNPDKDSNKSLYETLYSQMSTSTNFKEGLLSLSNLVFNTDFKPTSTKAQYVQSVYWLWQLSKFNPYNENGSIKQGKMAMKVLDADLASFTYNEDTSNSLYFYSHEIAYNVVYEVDQNHPGTTYTYYRIVRESAAPILIPYDSQKFAGIFFDNFSFKFNGNKIAAYESLPLNVPRGGVGSFNDDVLYGTYHIYQPVSLLSTNLDTKSAISTVNGDDININGSKINSLIPVFVLEFIDKSGDRSDAETVLGYVVDVAATFSGIGALSKLKHLRWAATGATDVNLFTVQGLRIVVGGIDFSSGVLGLFANFVECGENDGFCNAMKTFIVSLQLASLTVTVGDSLVSLVMKKQAAKVMIEAGGSTEAEIIQNIKDKITDLNTGANLDDVDATARTIYRSGYLYSFPANIVASIERKVKSFLSDIRNKKQFFLNSDYSELVIRDFVEFCYNLNLDQRTIEGLIIFANRTAKYIPPSQLKIQTTYFVKEILKRRFPAGIDNISNFRSFSNAFKNGIKQNLGYLDGNFDDALKNMEIVIKGSAVRSWKLGDVNLSGVALPARQAQDLDIAIKLNSKSYNLLIEELIYAIEELDIKIGVKNVVIGKIKSNVGKLQYDEVFLDIPMGNSNFSKLINDACQPYTRFVPDSKGKQTITFAFILKDGKYDTFPELPLEF